MEERFEVADHGVIWSFPARGRVMLELSSGEEGGFFRMERSRCGKFGESSALPRKFRLHRSEDGALAELETMSVIPFGCEYQVERACRVCSGVAELVSDFSAVNSGKVDGVELGALVFSGESALVEFLVFGEDEFRRCAPPYSGVLYAGAEPLLMLRVVSASGRRVEYALGADVWRHRGAMRIDGASSYCELGVADGALRLTRRVLAYDADTEPVRRSWRYTELLGWDDGGAEFPPAGEGDFELPGCAMGPAVSRELRRIVRRADRSLVWRGAEPGICADAAHTGRSGREDLEHFDLAEYLADWRWANRELAKRGYGFSIVPAAGNKFAGSVIVNKLAGVPGKLQ